MTTARPCGGRMSLLDQLATAEEMHDGFVAWRERGAFEDEPELADLEPHAATFADFVRAVGGGPCVH